MVIQLFNNKIQYFVRQFPGWITLEWAKNCTIFHYAIEVSLLFIGWRNTHAHGKWKVIIVNHLEINTDLQWPETEEDKVRRARDSRKNKFGLIFSLTNNQPLLQNG